MRELLSVEVKLDILKFLNYDTLFVIKQTNYHFNELINKYKEELARNQFYSFKLKFKNFVRRKKIKEIVQIQHFDISTYPINNELENKWRNAIQWGRNKYSLPTYISSNDAYVNSLNLNIKVAPKFVSVFLSKADPDIHSEYFRFDLPNYPTTVNDIRIIYYWLKQFSRCYYLHTGFNQFIFNPEIIKLIFDEDFLSIQFYCKSAYILFKNPYYYNSLVFNFAINHLYNCKHLHLNVNSFDEHNIILKFLFDNGTLFSQVSIIYTSTMNSRPLHDLIIHYILTSTKCSNMVANINFSSIYWSQPRLIFKAIKIEEGNYCISKSNNYKGKRKRRNKYSRIKYKLFNKFNPSIQFLITILNLNSSNHITEFKIKQL